MNNSHFIMFKPLYLSRSLVVAALTDGLTTSSFHCSLFSVILSVSLSFRPVQSDIIVFPSSFLFTSPSPFRYCLCLATLFWQSLLTDVHTTKHILWESVLYSTYFGKWKITRKGRHVIIRLTGVINKTHRGNTHEVVAKLCIK